MSPADFVLEKKVACMHGGWDARAEMVSDCKGMCILASTSNNALHQRRSEQATGTQTSKCMHSYAGVHTLLH
jgi:hypothetical protein